MQNLSSQGQLTGSQGSKLINMLQLTTRSSSQNTRYYIIIIPHVNSPYKTSIDERLIFYIIIPHVNSPYKTSIDERLIFHNITRCYTDGEYCHLFAIATGDIIKYQGGHMMRNADARTVRSCQEMINSNGRHDALFDDFKLQITSLFMARNIKCGYSFS